MKQEILVQLKSAEDETAKRIERAQLRAAELVKTARREAEELLRAAEEEARRDEESQLKQERAGMERERERILKEGEAKEAALRQAYARQVESFVKKGLDAFKRALHA